MKVTNFISLILCLAFLPDKGMGQNSKVFKELSNKNYYPLHLQMSEDGNWLSFLKNYDSNSDTLVLFRNNSLMKPIYQKIGFNSVELASHDYALLTANAQAELLNLSSGKSIVYDGVWRSSVLKIKSQIVLHYNEKSQNKVEVRDMNGSLIYSENNVKRYLIHNDSTLYLITNQLEGKSSLVTYKKNQRVILHCSENPIDDIYLDPLQSGGVIFSEKNAGQNKHISYVESTNGVVFELNDLLNFDPLWGNSKTIKEGESYFLTLYKNIPKQNKLVDIWYGNDNQLEKKFKEPVKEINYIWFPKQKKIQRIGSDELSKNAPLSDSGFFLSFNPAKLEDYTREQTLLEINIFNSSTNDNETLGTLNPELFFSPKGNFILNLINNEWHFFDLIEKNKTIIKSKYLGRPYFSDKGDVIYFDGADAVYMYEPKTEKLKKVADFPGYQTSILNFKTNIILNGYNFFQSTIDSDSPIILKLFDKDKNTSAIVSLSKNKISFIAEHTANHISSISHNLSYKNFAFWVENYNLPPVLSTSSINETQKQIFRTNPSDRKLNMLKQKVTTYKDAFNNELKGILYYPVNHDPSRQYPLIVHVYRQQNHIRNRYLNFEYRTGVGFNIRSLIEKGYFVYLPDIIIEKNGPGLSALDCIGKALDAMNEPSVNKSKTALIGHSFGGYITNFMATHSDYFTTYISGAGKSDLIHSYYAFNYNFLYPDFKRIESSIYNMKQSFSENKQKYFENNPIYFADSVKAPIMLWSGDKDENVPKSGSISFYLALKRNHKKVVALFYPNEQHSLFSTEAQTDLTIRMWDWIDYFLKDEKNIDWIEKEIKKDAS